MLDIRRARRRAAVCDSGISDVPPENPGATIDPADNSRRRRRRNEVLQPVDRSRGRSVAIHGKRKAVQKSVFGVFDTRFQQVDDGFLARVLQLLEPRDRDCNRRLPDRIFRRGKRLRRADVESLVSCVIAERFMIRICMSPCSSDYIIPFGSGARGRIILSSPPSR